MTSDLDDLHWRALPGEPGVAGVWGLTIVGWLGVASWLSVRWWNLLTVPQVQCTAWGCLPEVQVAVAFLVAWAVALGGAGFLAWRAWRARPRTLEITLTHHVLTVGAQRIVLADLRGVGAEGSALAVMTSDGDVLQFDLGESQVARDVARSVRQRVSRIDREPDAAARAWMASLEQLSAAR
ncbi:MAG: hypothetical protein R3F61_18775 [Myxococcota bacterium]